MNRRLELTNSRRSRPPTSTHGLAAARSSTITMRAEPSLNFAGGGYFLSDAFCRGKVEMSPSAQGSGERMLFCGVPVKQRRVRQMPNPRRPPARIVANRLQTDPDKRPEETKYGKDRLLNSILSAAHFVFCQNTPVQSMCFISSVMFCVLRKSSTARLQPATAP